MTVLGQRVALRMSVGIHSGLFHFFLVGDSHREFIVAGPGASTVVTMEGTADAGEIVVSPATARALRPAVIGAAKGPGFCSGGPRRSLRLRSYRSSRSPTHVDLVARHPRGAERCAGRRRTRSPNTVGSPWPSSTSTEPTR